MPFFIALLLIIIGVLIFWLGRRSQAEAGLPLGRVIYSDTRGWQPIEKPLFSRTHRLTGKPDYLVQQGREIIPVEVKSSAAPAAGPRRSHVLQLAAYCLLVEETYRHRPKYGIVKYADRVFASVRAAVLLDVLAACVMQTECGLSFATPPPAVGSRLSARTLSDWLDHTMTLNPQRR
jgi:CRISPR-associated exonuclease Cas4